MNKIIAQERLAQFRSGSFDEAKRTAEFVISSEAVDTYRTVFFSDGWNLKRYEKNPIVTYQHRDQDGNPDLVIGTSEVFLDDNKRLIGKITFEDGEDNPLAEKVFRKVKNGILRGASIWANPEEYRYGNAEAGEDPEVVYFTRSELISWSIVTVQSNPEALARNATGIDAIRAALVPEKKEQVVNKTGLSTQVARLQLAKYKSKLE